MLMRNIDVDSKRAIGVEPITIWNVCLASAALALVVWSLIEIRAQYLDTSNDFANIKRMNGHLVPGIDSMSDFDKAVALRNMLHTRVPVAVPNKDRSWKRMYREYRRAIMDPAFGHICGGLQKLYMAALKAHGIRSRRVSMFVTVSDATDPLHSHATVDVFLDGRWIAMDPTYNFSLRHDGQQIGWLDAADLLESGHRVSVETEGHQILERYATLHLTEPLGGSKNFLTAFLNYITIGPYMRPATWDGYVRFKDGRTIDVAVSGMNRGLR